MQKGFKFFLILLLSFSVFGCSSSSEKEITVYLLKRDVPDPEKTKNVSTIITALRPKKFIIWKEKNIVISSNSMGEVNKDCVVVNKDNWYCYLGEDKRPGIKDWQTFYFISDGGKWLNVEHGILNGNWVKQYKYREVNSSEHIEVYSVPYWEWLLYEFKIFK